MLVAKTKWNMIQKQRKMQGKSRIEYEGTYEAGKRGSIYELKL